MEIGDEMTPESKVKKEVEIVLKNLQFSGDLIYCNRVNTGKIKTEWGSWVQLAEIGHWDWIALFIGKERNLCFCFIEHKRADKPAKLDPKQIEFKEKYDGKHANIHFWLVKSGAEVKALVSKFGYDRMEDIEL